MRHVRRAVRVSLVLMTLASTAALAQAQPPGTGRPMIVGGQVAQPGAWPWQSFLLAQGNFGCGGSLIAPQWVLTAAHCLFRGPDGQPKTQLPNDQLFAIFGLQDQRVLQNQTLPPEIQVRQVVQSFVNESYDQTTQDNDIALLQVSPPFNLTERVAVIGLVTPDEEAAIAGPGVMATVTGWGATSNGGQVSDELRQVALPIVSNDDCSALYPQLTDNMLCAGGLPQGGEDSCQGDSGGPLVVPAGGGTYKQAGVVSFGNQCALPGIPGVYTRVSRYIDWIASKMGGASKPSGLQTTPDGQRTLINKPVGAEQWGITRNEDGTVTGNIFYTDGRDPQFLTCTPTGDDGNPDPAAVKLRFACSLASKCTAAQCPAPGDWVALPSEVELAGSFFLPRVSSASAASVASAASSVDAGGSYAAVLASGASGLQTTPDGQRTLINKPVGAEQWAITENASDQSVTGNIFYTDGRDPQFVSCQRLGDDGNPDPAVRLIRYACSLSAKCATAQCPGANDWVALPSEVTLPRSFLLPRAGG